MSFTKNPYFIFIVLVLFCGVLAGAMYEAVFTPLPVYAEEAELIYNRFNIPQLDYVIGVTDRIEELLPEVGIEQRDLLVATWISFEAHVSGPPISSVDPLYLDTTFSVLESTNLDYQTLIKAELLRTPNVENRNTHVLVDLDYLDELLSRLEIVRDSVVRYHRYHEAVQ